MTAPFRKMSLCTALVFASLSLAACDKPEDKEAKYIARGNNHFEDGKYDKARVDYKNAARINPTDPELFYRIGLLDEAEGNLGSAFRNFIGAEQQDAHHNAASLKVAQYFLISRREDEAERRIRAVLTDNPENAEAHALFAVLLSHQKNKEGALKEARLALEKEPSNITGLTILAGLLADSGDMPGAFKVLEEGIEKNPKEISLLMLRASLATRQKDWALLNKTYQKIFTLKPDATQYRLELTMIYSHEGMIDEAEKTLRDGIKDLPTNDGLKHALASFLNDKRGVDVAEKELRKFIAADPKQPDYMLWLADLFLARHDNDKAQKVYEQVLLDHKGEQGSRKAAVALAQMAINAGDKTKANAYIGTALSQDHNDPHALFMQAQMYFDDGLYENAVIDLRTIIKNDPKVANVYPLLAETLLRQNNLELAIDTLSQMLEIAPNEDPARVRLAQLLEMKGESRRALGLLEKVTSASPKLASGWETTALIAIKIKDWALANKAILALREIEGHEKGADFLEGQLFGEQGKRDQAFAKWQKMIEEDPSSDMGGRALAALVDLDHKLGRVPDSLRYLQSLKTNSPFVLTVLANTQLELGHKDAAIQAYDKVLAGNPTFQEPYIARANLLLGDKKLDEAIALLKKGAEAAPHDPRALNIVAMLLDQTGRYAEAKALYEEILTRAPNNDAAANNLAEIIADHEADNKDALAKARQLVDHFKTDPNPLFLDTLVWVAFLQDDLDTVQSLLDRLTSYDKPLPPQTHYHMGAILAKLGRKNEAKVELDKALAGDQTYAGKTEAKKIRAGL